MTWQEEAGAMHEPTFEYAVTCDRQGVAVGPARAEYVDARTAKRGHAAALALGEAATLWRRRRYGGGWEIARRAA